MTKEQAAIAFVEAYQAYKGLRVDGWAGKDTWAAAGLTAVTPDSGLPDGYLAMLSKIESNDQPYIKARTSSASGLYQFIKSSWIGEGGSWGSNMELAFGGLRPPTDEQTRRAITFTNRNVAYLTRYRIPINRASLYAAHFLGASMAVKIIGADVKASAEAIAGPAATKANPSILKGKTVGDFMTWLHKKTGQWAR